MLPWTAPGFPSTSEINPSVYDDPDNLGFDVFNGLVYRAGGRSVIVTIRVRSCTGWPTGATAPKGSAIAAAVALKDCQDSLKGKSPGADEGHRTL
jgi:hypothetical protein